MTALIKAKDVVLNDSPTYTSKTINLSQKHENEPDFEAENENNELRKEYEKEIDNLKKEVIDAHKQVTEWQEKYHKLDERFSAVLLSKDQAMKINQSLENRLHDSTEEIKRLNEEINQLNQEIFPLRQLSLLKLSKDVNTA